MANFRIKFTFFLLFIVSFYTLDNNVIDKVCKQIKLDFKIFRKYEGWNFNSGNYLFTTDTK